MSATSSCDLLPEAFLGAIGYADDVVLAAYAVHSLVNDGNSRSVKRHWAGNSDVLALVRQILAVAGEMVGLKRWNKLKRTLDSFTG